MGFDEWFNIINTIIGIIGIIVGVIGGKSLHAAMKLKNVAKDIQNSTIQQAQTITVNNNNGMDTYAVIKLSKETTQEELEKIVTQINQTKNKIEQTETKLVQKIAQTETKVAGVEVKIDSLPPIPQIHTSNTSPTRTLREGEFWGRY